LIKNKGLELCNLVVKLQVYGFFDDAKVCKKCINFNNLDGKWVFREYKIIGMDEMRGFGGLLLIQKAPFTGPFAGWQFKTLVQAWR